MNDILQISRAEQYQAIDRLLTRSQADSLYFGLLVLSSIIIAGGLLINSSAIVIGGMLVTPVLTPVLSIALGIATGQADLLQDTGLLVLKSMGIILGTSFILAILLGTPDELSLFIEDSLRSGIIYFVVAIASGIAATFAWIRKELSEVLPGIAIAVSLVPPLSVVAIALAMGDFDVSRFYFLVFVFNMLGIVLGSLVVFSMTKFAQADRMVDKKQQEVKKEQVRAKIEEAKAQAKKLEEEVQIDAEVTEETSEKSPEITN